MAFTKSNRLPLSSLLQEMENHGGNFLCHTAEEIIYEKNYQAGVSSYWPNVCPKQTYDELKRIMPEHILDLEVEDVVSGSLNTWAKNLPEKVDYHLNNSSLMQFRISFLKWAISTFGDQEINFHVIGAEDANNIHDE